MMNKSLILSLATLFIFACASHADDDEMKTETKPSVGPALPTDITGKLPPPGKVPTAADHALRAKIRKLAPFWIEDSAHGAAIRLNKDGTFSSEAQGGGSIAGQWKALGGQLHLQWSDGVEKYSYPVSGKGSELLIKGERVKKNRYQIH